MSCDKAKRSEPCDLSEVGMASCPCGKVYERCKRHGGEAGAKRSRHSHMAATCPLIYSRRPPAAAAR